MWPLTAVFGAQHVMGWIKSMIVVSYQSSILVTGYIMKTWEPTPYQHTRHLMDSPNLLFITIVLIKNGRLQCLLCCDQGLYWCVLLFQCGAGKLADQYTVKGANFLSDFESV